MANFDMGLVLASKWMAKDDVTPQGVDLQIVNVTEEAIGEDLEQKFAMHFSGGYKPLILNRTNIRIAMSLYGTQTTGWIGKPICVYQDPTVSMAGRMVGGVRLRMPQAIPQPAATPQQYRQASGAIPGTLVDDIPF